MSRYGLFFLLLIPCSAYAQDSYQTWQAEIDERVYARTFYFDYREADTTLQVAFHRAGIGWARRYTQAWGNNGLYLAWNDAKPIYTDLHYALTQWRSAIIAGRVTDETAMRHSEAAMAMLTPLDDEVGRLLWQIVELDVLRAQILDAYNAVPLSERERKDALYALAQVPLGQIAEARQALRAIGQLDLLALPPEAASGPLDPFALANQLAQSENAAVRRAAVRVLAHLIAGTEHDPESERAAVLVLLADHHALTHDAVWTALLDAEGLTAGGAAVLRDGLLDRASLLFEAYPITEDTDWEALSTLARAAAGAAQSPDGYPVFPAASQRFTMRVNDRLPSATDGLSSASIRSSARQILALTGWAAGAPQISPYFLPTQVSGQLAEASAQSLQYGARGVEGVTASINGDPSGTTRALSYGRQIEDTLTGRQFVSRLQSSARSVLQAAPSSVRSAVNWLLN